MKMDSDENIPLEIHGPPDNILILEESKTEPRRRSDQSFEVTAFDHIFIYHQKRNKKIKILNKPFLQEHPSLKNRTKKFNSTIVLSDILFS